MTKVSVNVQLKTKANVSASLKTKASVSAKINGPTVTETVPSTGQIYFKIPAGSLSAQWQNADSDFTVDSVDTVNIDSYTIRKNGTLQGALPITFNVFDEINIQVVPTNTSLDTEVTLNDNSLADISLAFYPPKVDKTRHHIAALRYTAVNGGAGVVDIIDCSTNTIHSTVTLPTQATVSSLCFWTGPAYDSDRDYWVFFERLAICYIQADPNHADFGKIIDPATGNASPGYTIYFSNGDGYTWYNLLYDPFHNANGTYQKNRNGIVFQTNDSYMFARGYNSNSGGSQSVANVAPNIISAPSGDGWYFWLTNGDLACLVRPNSFEQWTRYKNDYWSSGNTCNWKCIKSNGAGGGGFNSGHFIYIPSLGKYFGGTHQFRVLNNRDLSQEKLIVSIAGGGTSAFYQMMGGTAYDPVNKYLLGSHYWLQNSTFSKLYCIDCQAEVNRATYEIPNIDNVTWGAPKHFPQMLYCPYNGYIYHAKMHYGVTANGNGLGGLNVYDVTNWLANGRVSVNDLFVGQITWGGSYGWNSNKYDTFRIMMAGNWIDLPFE